MMHRLLLLLLLFISIIGQNNVDYIPCDPIIVITITITNNTIMHAINGRSPRTVIITEYHNLNRTPRLYLLPTQHNNIIKVS